MRHGLCGDLGFPTVHRIENIRLIGKVAKLFLEAGGHPDRITPSAATAKRRARYSRTGRGLSGDLFPLLAGNLRSTRHEEAIQAPRSGEVTNFTGISSPYEESAASELVVDTHLQSQEESVELVMRLLRERCVI